MEYNFENKIAETDSDVKLYLDEGMHFEAWINYPCQNTCGGVLA